MDDNSRYKRNVRIATMIIVVASIVGASLIAIVSLPGIGLLSPYQEYHTDLTISPPASSYSISISANDSNIQIYQGGNNSIYVDVTVSGWVRLSNENVYISREVVGDSVNLVVNTPRFFAAFTANAKLYLPSGATAGYLTAKTSNGNENVYGALNAVNMTLSTTNGNIGTSGLSSGRVYASTVNGNIDVTAVNLSSCNENTVNGNLHLTISEILKSGTYSLNSVNGNQDLYINKLSNATLALSTVNGNIAVINLVVETTVSSSHTLEGTMNGGGASVSMKTSNGNLRITGT